MACDRPHTIQHPLFTKTIMMPLAPTPIVAIPTKPKIGFSIDSIVGSQNNNNNNNNSSVREREYAKRERYSPNSEGSDRAPSPASDNSYHNSSLHRRRGSLSPPVGPADRTPPPPMQPQMPPAATASVPAPAILRPSPMAPHAAAAAAAAASLPYHLNQQDLVVHAHNQHFLAAQFQVAAALAHNHGAAAAQNAFAHAAAAHGHHPPAAGHHSPAAPRDSYPLYPWLLSRHGRIFPHRFPGGK